jgi:hypothetical protein
MAMRQRQRSPEEKALRKRFHQWAEIVEVFARRRAARKRVDPRAYIALRREVIEECQRLADSANEVDGAFYRYIENLVQPWLDLSVLARGERDILFDLLLRCRHVQTQLGGQAWHQAIPSWRAAVAVALMFFAIILLFLGRVPVSLRTILNGARDWADHIYIQVVRSTELERLFFVGCVLVVVSMFVVMRTARS